MRERDVADEQERVVRDERPARDAARPGSEALGRFERSVPRLEMREQGHQVEASQRERVAALLLDAQPSGGLVDEPE